MYTKYTSILVILKILYTIYNTLHKNAPNVVSCALTNQDNILL